MANCLQSVFNNQIMQHQHKFETIFALFFIENTTFMRITEDTKHSTRKKTSRGQQVSKGMQAAEEKGCITAKTRGGVASSAFL